MSDDYDVGYGKPPRHSQFKLGQSGNPQGRPKGSKDLKTDLLEELSEMMKVTEGGRVRHLSKQRVLIKALMTRGLNGNDRAAAKILDLYLRILVGDDLDDATEKPPSQEEREVLEVLEARIRRKLNMQSNSSAGESS